MQGVQEVLLPATAKFAKVIPDERNQYRLHAQVNGHHGSFEICLYNECQGTSVDVRCPSIQFVCPAGVSEIAETGSFGPQAESCHRSRPGTTGRVRRSQQWYSCRGYGGGLVDPQHKEL